MQNILGDSAGYFWWYYRIFLMTLQGIPNHIAEYSGYSSAHSWYSAGYSCWQCKLFPVIVLGIPSEGQDISGYITGYPWWQCKVFLVIEQDVLLKLQGENYTNSTTWSARYVLLVTMQGIPGAVQSILSRVLGTYDDSATYSWWQYREFWRTVQGILGDSVRYLWYECRVSWWQCMVFLVLVQGIPNLSTGLFWWQCRVF
jgi:hypothetical protein